MSIVPSPQEDSHCLLELQKNQESHVPQSTVPQVPLVLVATPQFSTPQIPERLGSAAGVQESEIHCPLASHENPELQVPQSKVPPQPSLNDPQTYPKSKQVLGVQVLPLPAT